MNEEFRERGGGGCISRTDAAADGPRVTQRLGQINLTFQESEGIPDNRLHIYDCARPAKTTSARSIHFALLAQTSDMTKHAIREERVSHKINKRDDGDRDEAIAFEQSPA